MSNKIFVDVKLKKYPVKIENLKSDYSNVSFPSIITDDFLSFLGLVEVQPVMKPVETTGFSVIEDYPREQAGKFFQNWKIVKSNLTPREQAARFEETKKLKILELSKLRFEKEVSGISVSGISVKTDRESQSQLATAVLTIKERFANSINWKGDNGWVNLNQTQILHISKMVSQYVQGCFNVEQMHYEKINNARSVEEINSYDLTVGWPTQQY